MANSQQSSVEEGVMGEAEQRWSRGRKGPLACILVCESQGEAAAICALRCFLYVLCNGKTGGSGSLYPCCFQQEMQHLGSSASSLIACAECGAREPVPKAERWVTSAPAAASFYKGYFMQGV